MHILYQNEYILELMKYMPVTSVGHCFKTHDILAASGAEKGDRKKIAVNSSRSERKMARAADDKYLKSPPFLPSLITEMDCFIQILALV